MGPVRAVTTLSSTNPCLLDDIFSIQLSQTEQMHFLFFLFSWERRNFDDFITPLAKVLCTGLTVPVSLFEQR